MQFRVSAFVHTVVVKVVSKLVGKIQRRYFALFDHYCFESQTISSVSRDSMQNPIRAYLSLRGKKNSSIHKYILQYCYIPEIGCHVATPNLIINNNFTDDYSIVMRCSSSMRLFLFFFSTTAAEEYRA